MKRILSLLLVFLAAGTLLAQEQQRTKNPQPIDIPSKPVF